MDPRVMGHLDERVLPIGINANELHTLRFVFFCHLDKPLAVKFGERTFSPQKHNDRSTFFFPCGRRMFGAQIVVEREFSDPRAN